MTEPLRIHLIGDHDPTVTAHRAIPLALTAAAGALGREVEPVWVGTRALAEAGPLLLEGADGVWCVPVSPYESMEGALHGIRHARERGVPFLGTCAGFQHALVEYARDVAGLADADHAETNASAATLVVTPLSCGLVETDGRVRLVEGSRARRAYGAAEVVETYHCNYGLNRALRPRLEDGRLRFTGFDPAGEARVLELEGHPFFLATLFQPERSALRGERHPLVEAFLGAAARAELAA